MQDARALLEKWVETRRVLSAEKRDWALGREVLLDRIEVVKHEVESLNAREEETRGSIADASAKLAELQQRRDELKGASADLLAGLATLEARTKQLLGRLPDPVRARVKALSQRLPEDPQTSTQSLSERFLNVVGLLNEVNKAQREVYVTTEVRTLADGAVAEVATVYVGLGSGFYVSADGKLAGVGRATQDGWVWTPASEAAAEIAHVIAILKNEQVGAFVRLPVQLGTQGS